MGGLTEASFGSVIGGEKGSNMFEKDHPSENETSIWWEQNVGDGGSREVCVVWEIAVQITRENALNTIPRSFIKCIQARVATIRFDLNISSDDWGIHQS